MAALTPSEVALLHGAEFAQKKMLRNVKLLDGETKVSAVDLGRTLVAVAVLANEEKGVLTLEPRKRKSLLGAMGLQKLWIQPAEGAVEWPEGSLEARVAAAARTLGAQRDAEDVLTAVFEEETHDAFVHAVTLAKRGLAARGLLEVEEKKALGFLKYDELRAPPALLEAARAAGADAVKRRLDEAQRRADVWKMLVSDIKDAAQRQTTAPDGPD